MLYNPSAEDGFTELSILREKAQTALSCIIDNAAHAQEQTLAYIANDYLCAMQKMIHALRTCEEVTPP